MKFVSALLVLTVGAALLQWFDLFHLAVALPLIGGATVLGRWLMNTTRVDEEEDVDPDEEAALVRVLRGALIGVVLLLVAAGGVFAATRSPLYGWFYDRDLQTLLERIQILESASAYDEVIRIIDERRVAEMSSAAREQLNERRVRALIHSADQRQGEHRLITLRTAMQEADRIHASDLRQLVGAKLHAIENEVLLAQVRLAVEQSARGLLIKLPDVLFQPGKAALIDSALGQIRQIVDLVDHPDNIHRRVSVEGHADGIGDEAFNQQLSEGRASSVATALTRAGVHGSRITTRGFGSTVPAAPNNTVEGRTKNRRVEIVVLEPGT